MKACFNKLISLLTVLATILALTPTPAHTATIVYVVPGGTGNGTSWATGKDLAAALAAATSGTHLYIKTGTYKPGTSTDATFTLKSGVELHGGFAGVDGENIPTTCANPSILSGNIGDESIATDNSKNVVTSSNVNSTAVLDCLLIQDGYAGYAGGGINNSGGSPTLNSVTIKSNYATYIGGGMYNSGGSPTLTNVTFQNNTANEGGGGMYNEGQSHPILNQVTFTGNISNTSHGGGMSNSNSSPTLTDVTFENNASNGSNNRGNGGGMYVYMGSASLTHVTFRNNVSKSYGGGMSIESSSSPAPVLTGVIFEENQSTGGGGLYVRESTLTLTNVTFRGNRAISDLGALGGGMANYYSSTTTLTNVIFTGNDAKKGGGLANYYSNSSVTLNQATFSGNHCTDGSNCGAGIYNYASGNSTLHNSIVWGNVNGQILNDSGTTTHIAYSIVQGSGGSVAGWVASAGTDEGNNLDIDPHFVASVPYPDTANTGDVHLQAGSPAINNGNNSYIPSGVNTDLGGNNRKVNDTVDMGAYEFQNASSTPPETSITASPASRSNDKNPSFSFSSDQTGSTFQCKLDSNDWENPCASPKAYSNLADGSHTFQVYATNGSYYDWTPASYTWTIDTVEDTTIDASSKPANPTHSTSASFSYHCSEASCTYQCKLDAAADWGSCAPYTGLAEGEHTFQVRATDPLGNVDTSPAGYTWTVDLTPPVTAIDSHPDDPSTSQSAAFTYSSTENGSNFQCQLDSGAWETCPGAKNYSALADGAHTFQVQATDVAGNTDPSPASFTWTVKAPPETTIQSRPPSLTNSSSASFTFSSSEDNSTFQCTLDGGAAAACTSPQDYAGLADGTHTFQVQATDPASNADPSPASYAWSVDTTPPVVTFDSHPENPSNSNHAAFAFSSESGAVFECKLNGYAWYTCTSPVNYYSLTNSENAFQVRATDAAGNISTSPAVYTWSAGQAPIVAFSSGMLSVGYEHACAIQPNGSVDCWGDNSLGQSTDQTGLFTRVSAGYYHTCALTTAGAVNCWGTQGSQYDYGQAASQPGPYTQVSSGSAHTCALTPTGAVNCWGIHDGSLNDYGQAASQPGPYTQVSAGSVHTCALKADGAVDCWGNNLYGQAVNQPGPYIQVSAGYGHTCALKADGAVDCWGNNLYGQAVNQPGPYIQISAGYVHTCGLTLSGAVDCWGNNSFSQAASQPGPYIEISSGTQYSCGLTPTGAVNCWGEGATSQAGPYGLPETSLNLYKIKNPGATFEFSSSEANDTFECRLNENDWESCESPKVYTNLEKGKTYTFQVRAVGATGIADPTPSSFTWTVSDYWDYFPLIGK